jgi:hypothetical protein
MGWSRCGRRRWPRATPRRFTTTLAGRVGLNGVWLPTIQPGADRERCVWPVEDWLAGWDGQDSHNGTRWRALRRIRLCPWRIGDITAAALVLSTFERGHY